jgi:hypothetical protein
MPTGLREVYSQLVAWEREAHGHAHLENNVLVPWAAALDPVTNRRFATSRTAPAAPIVVAV